MNSSNCSGRLSSADGSRKPYSTSVVLRARSPLNMPPIWGRVTCDSSTTTRNRAGSSRTGRPGVRPPAGRSGGGSSSRCRRRCRPRAASRRRSWCATRAAAPRAASPPPSARPAAPQLGADEPHRALDLGALGDEVLGRVDGALVELGDGIAGERVDLADPLDLVAPELDADGLLGVGGEDLDRVAPDPEGALLEGGVVAGVLDADQLARGCRPGPRCSPRRTVTMSFRYSTGSPRP